MPPRRIALAAAGFIGLLAVASPARAQTVNPAANVSSVVRGGVVIVSYDLVSKDQNAQFSVGLEVSSDGGKTYAIQPRTLKGDVGASVRAGTGKQITWEAARDVENLEVDRYRYRVTATPAATPAAAPARTAQSPTGTSPPGPAAKIPEKKGSGRKWAGIGLLAGGGALAVMSSTVMKTKECDEFDCYEKTNTALLWGGIGAAGGGIALLAIGGPNGNATQVVVGRRAVVVQQQVPIQKLLRTLKP